MDSFDPVTPAANADQYDNPRRVGWLLLTAGLLLVLVGGVLLARGG